MSVTLIVKVIIIVTGCYNECNIGCESDDHNYLQAVTMSITLIVKVMIIVTGCYNVCNIDCESDDHSYRLLQ